MDTVHTTVRRIFSFLTCALIGVVTGAVIYSQLQPASQPIGIIAGIAVYALFFFILDHFEAGSGIESFTLRREQQHDGNGRRS